MLPGLSFPGLPPRRPLSMLPPLPPRLPLSRPLSMLPPLPPGRLPLGLVVVPRVVVILPSFRSVLVLTGLIEEPESLRRVMVVVEVLLLPVLPPRTVVLLPPRLVALPVRVPLPPLVFLLSLLPRFT